MVDEVKRSGGPDADEVLRVGKITLQGLRDSGTGVQKPIELLETLFESTGDYLRDGVSIDKAQFTAAELNARLKGQSEHDDSPEVARRYVNDNLNKLSELLQEQRGAIDNLLRASGTQYRLLVNKSGSKGRNKAHIYLDLEPIDGSQVGSGAELPAHFVQYRVHQLPKPPFWAKPFLRYPLEGKVMWIYGAAMALAAILTLSALALLLQLPAPLRLGLIGLAIALGWLLWTLFGPFFSVVELGVVSAPEWLLGLHEHYGQLELRRTERFRSNGKNVREIRLVRYHADCPICTGEIDVRPGRGEFRNRLIGVCQEAGAEHRFSFDHITKVGVPLRSNSYYGQTQ